MTLRAGFFVANLPGKQAGAPATTTANSSSSYVFSTGTTSNIGSVVVTKRTDYSFQLPGYDAPTNTLTFNGSQGIAYYANSNLHVQPLPYSIQVDFNTSQNSLGTSYIVNQGQGNGTGWPEVCIVLNQSNLNVYTATNNTGTGSQQAAFYIAQNIQINTWYRVGVMFYNTGGSNYVRFYLNGIEQYTHRYQGISFQRDPFDPSRGTNAAASDGLPWQSTNGIALGSDNRNDPNSHFQGSIRNFFAGKTLFWPI